MMYVYVYVTYIRSHIFFHREYWGYGNKIFDMTSFLCKRNIVNINYKVRSEERPPSMCSTWPVIYFEESLRSNSTYFAISSGCPTWYAGVQKETSIDNIHMCVYIYAIIIYTILYNTQYLYILCFIIHKRFMDVYTTK